VSKAVPLTVGKDVDVTQAFQHSQFTNNNKIPTAPSCASPGRTRTARRLADRQRAARDHRQNGNAAPVLGPVRMRTFAPAKVVATEETQ